MEREEVNASAIEGGEGGGSAEAVVVGDDDVSMMYKKIEEMTLEGVEEDGDGGKEEEDDQDKVAKYSDALLPEERWNKSWQPSLQTLMEAYPEVPLHDLKNFLIYVHGDLAKARERIEICLAWRRQHMPIERKTVLKPLEQGIFFFRGFDKAGRPVGYFTLKGHDRRHRNIEEYIKAVVYQSEKLIERMGTSKYRIIVIVDRRGANILSQDLELYKAFFKTFGELYPMKLYRVILYPATAMTRILWSLLKPFLHNHVQRRLILATDPADLTRFVEPDQLIESLGGENRFDFRSDI